MGKRPCIQAHRLFYRGVPQSLISWNSFTAVNTRYSMAEKIKKRIIRYTSKKGGGAKMSSNFFFFNSELDSSAVKFS